MRKTIFERIIDGELPANKVFENEQVFAIHDLYPAAPVHLLIISKKVIPSLQLVEPADLPLVGEMIRVAQELAKEFDIASDYRLITNVGVEAGQSIFHLHFHLIGGRHLGLLG